ncbi:MAG TPA: hypothetical protein DDE71_04800 [Tenacibaculum sp.]|nr:hypothetical protein [Tenacibaculum sp.]
MWWVGGGEVLGVVMGEGVIGEGEMWEGGLVGGIDTGESGGKMLRLRGMGTQRGMTMIFMPPLLTPGKLLSAWLARKD